MTTDIEYLPIIFAQKPLSKNGVTRENRFFLPERLKHSSKQYKT
jgi:hypothetical protein